jgi:hypothetical protein
MTPRLVLAISAAAAVLGLAVSPVAAAEKFVPGQKLDSGLGELPHYSKWTDASGRHPTGHRVVGESIDSGLGELPHYSKWVDTTGKDPLGKERTQLSQTRR